jgi:hypothetical protein
MSVRAEEIKKTADFQPLRASGLAQRKCACGGSAGFNAGCEDCESARLSGKSNSRSAPSTNIVPGPVPFGSVPPEIDAGDSETGGDVFDFGETPITSPEETEAEEGPAQETVAQQAGPTVPPPNAATTPDGVNLGPTDTTKRGCAHHFFAQTSVVSNTATAAAGRQDITFRANNSGNSEGVPCDCSCLVYRHFVKGFWRTGSATAAKRHDVTSCGNALTMNESTFTEEFTTCIGDNDADACKWAYADAPGWLSGLSEGSFVQLHYAFRYQIWDACNNRSVAISGRTLDISGSNTPRTVRWSGG